MKVGRETDYYENWAQGGSRERERIIKSMCASAKTACCPHSYKHGITEEWGTRNYRTSSGLINTH